MPLAEAQSAWIAELLCGRYHPPSRKRIRNEMLAEHDLMDRCFYRSARHTMEVDFDGYLADLRSERGPRRTAGAEGRGRARLPTASAVDRRGRAGTGTGMSTRVVAITGAARGIDLATAETLIARGARVVLGDLFAEEPEDARARERPRRQRGQRCEQAAARRRGDIRRDKHAVYGYSTAVREELRGSGVELSVIMPVVVETQLAAGTSHGKASPASAARRRRRDRGGHRGAEVRRLRAAEHRPMVAPEGRPAPTWARHALQADHARPGDRNRSRGARRLRGSRCGPVSTAVLASARR